MMNEATIKFIVSRVIENAKDAREEARHNKNDDFYRGKNLAYYEILDTIKNELVVRDEALTEFGLDIDLEKEFFEDAQQHTDPAGFSVDSIDPYISGYFFLQSVKEYRPLTEEEQARFDRCAQELQKRRELREFDRWLEESFGIKIDSVPPNSDLFDD